MSFIFFIKRTVTFELHIKWLWCVKSNQN